MTIALDIGASQLRTLRRDDNRLIARSVDTLYSVLADTPAHRRLLDQAGIPFLLCDRNLVLLSESAEESASLFRVPSRRLLPHGRVPAADPVARQLLACLIEAVLPTAAAGGEICCLAIPSGIALESGQSHSDVEFYSRIIRLQGYIPKIVPASQSLILAELVDSSFTGIGLIFGASGCEAILAHRGQALCHAQTSFGGDAIDEQLRERNVAWHPPIANEAESPAEIIDEITIQKLREAAVPSERAPSASLEHVIAELLRRAGEKLIAAFDTELRRTPKARTVPGPVAVICAGGLAQTPGFDRLISDVIGQCQLPVACQTPRIADVSARSVLRGLLICGEVESPPLAEKNAA